MEIDMRSIEVAKSGEQGTVKFTPNSKAKDTAKLRMVQIGRLETTAGTDFNWTGEQARRNDVKTTEKGKEGEVGHVASLRPETATSRSRGSAHVHDGERQDDYDACGWIA
jgi:hypothetical protein